MRDFSPVTMLSTPVDFFVDNLFNLRISYQFFMYLSTKKENKICPIDELSTGFHHILWLAENSGKIFLSPLADYTEWMKIFLFIRE